MLIFFLILCHHPNQEIMSNQEFTPKEINPLGSLDEWEDDLLERYPDPKKLLQLKQQKPTGIMRSRQEIP